jgi:hypothetical protein
MSSGLAIGSLNVAAALVLRSLLEQPDRQTPQEIADGSPESGRIDADGARRGLGELAAHGLAAEDSGGRWHLTKRGRAAQQQSDSSR